jgi:hypothetical protein
VILGLLLLLGQLRAPGKPVAASLAMEEIALGQSFRVAADHPSEHMGFLCVLAYRWDVDGVVTRDQSPMEKAASGVLVETFQPITTPGEHVIGLQLVLRDVPTCPAVPRVTLRVIAR